MSEEKKENKTRSNTPAFVVVGMVLALGVGAYQGHKVGYNQGQQDLVKSATMAQKLAGYVTPTTAPVTTTIASGQGGSSPQ